VRVISDSFDNNNLTKHLDVLKEIGNIGAGHAASSLASLLNRKIEMSVPEADLLPFNQVVEVLDGPETLVAGVCIDVRGDLNGFILLVLSMDDALTMISQALQEPMRDTTAPDFELTELERDTLLEICNILVGAFLSAITSFSGLGATPSVPQLSVDMLGAILSIALIEYGTIGDSALCMKTQLVDVEGDMNGHFFLIPDYNSYKMLLKALGLEG